MTELIVRPAADSDDGYANGALYNTGEIQIGRVDNDQRCFCRFPNVTIPKGATIISAVLTIRTTSTARADTVVFANIYASQADNPSAPGTNAAVFALSGGSGSGTWNVGAPVAANTNYNSPSLTTVIQEIIDRAGWASGNAILLFTTATATMNDYSQSNDYSISSSTCWILTINYTPAEGGQVLLFSHG